MPSAQNKLGTNPYCEPGMIEVTTDFTGPIYSRMIDLMHLRRLDNVLKTYEHGIIDHVINLKADIFLRKSRA